MKKIYYNFVIILQGTMILSTIINIVYCFIVSKVDIFLTSIFLMFVPLNRFLNENNYYELLVLLFFGAITIIFYIFSVKETLNKYIEKTPFLIINALWFYISNFSIMFLDSNEATIILQVNPIFISIVAISLILLIILKWIDLNKLYRNKSIPNFEDPLPENFQLQAKSYEQIKRTALGTAVISIGVFLFNLLLIYINNTSSILLIFRNFMYSFCMFFEIIIFFGTIHDCKAFEKKTGQKPPLKKFLKKLNIIQILSIVLLAISFFVLNLF